MIKSYSNEYIDYICKFLNDLQKKRKIDILGFSETKWRVTVYYQDYEDDEDDEDIVENSASSNLSSQWINCEEQNPEKDGYYYVITDNTYSNTYDIAKFENKEWQQSSKILYWMEIPYHPDFPVNKTIFNKWL